MRRLRYLLAAIGTICACVAGSAAAAPGDNVFVDTSQISGEAEFTSEEGGTVSPTAFTVPNWADSFTYGGATFPYSMVGTNPANGAVTTTVKTAIIPIDLNFKAGLGGALKGGDRVAAMLASPIFQGTDFSVLRNVYVLASGYLGDQTGPPVTLAVRQRRV